MGLPTIKVAHDKENGNHKFYISLEHYYDDVKDIIKSIDGAFFQEEVDGEENVWVVPARQEAVRKIDMINTKVEKTKNASIVWDKLQEEDKAGISHNIGDVDISDYDPVYDHWDHQEKALKLSRVKDNLALLYEMGAGKTKSAIDITCDRFQRDELSSALVLAPKSVMQVWYKEMEEHSVIPYDMIDLHCDANAKQRERQLRKFKDYAPDDSVLTMGVTTYDSAWRLTDDLNDCEIDSIIADESTDIKTHDAQRTEGAIELAKSDSVDYRMILTGTAITNSPLDAWSQYEFLDPDIFNQNYYQFEHTYAIKGGYNNKQVVAYKNLDDLKRKVHLNAIRVTKDECLDLPPKIFNNRYVTLSNKERKKYDNLKKESIVRLQNKDTVTVNCILAELAKLQQLANGFIHYEEIEELEVEGETKKERFGKSKINELKNVIDETGEEKMVVWCKFREDIRAIEEMFDNKYDFRHVSLHGGTSDRSGELETQFHEDPETKLFISQIQTGAKGIDLTPASDVVYYSNSFSLDNYLQSQDRCHRKGQDNKVTYTHLLTEESVDIKIHNSLQSNEKLAKEIMDDYRDGSIEEYMESATHD